MHNFFSFPNLIVRFFFLVLTVFSLLIPSNEVLAATFKQDLLSPVTTDASYFFWPSMVSTTFLLLNEDSISDPITAETSERKPLGNFSELGDLYGQLYPNIIYTFYMMGKGLLNFDKSDSYRKASHMARATFYSGLMTTFLKYTVRAPRPDNNKERNSFPSGHTTTAFAFGTVVALEHEWYLGVLALGGAALTGFSRINDGRHFLNDVFAGMSIGVSYALGTYFTQFGQGRMYAFTPIATPQTIGVNFTASF